MMSLLGKCKEVRECQQQEEVLSRSIEKLEGLLYDLTGKRPNGKNTFNQVKNS